MEPGLFAVPGSDAIPHGLVFQSGAIVHFQRLRQGEHFLGVRAAGGTHGEALVHKRHDGDLPAVPHGTQAVVVLDADVREVHLVEAGLPRGLLDRPDLHPRRLHVHDEHGEALVLGHGGVRAGQEDAVITVLGPGGPDLLAVDDPLVPVLHGAGTQVGDVRAPRGFGEELAPDFFAGGHLGKVGGPLLIPRKTHDHRATHAQADGKGLGGDVVASLFLVPNDHFHGRGAPAAEGLGPVQAGPAVLLLQLLPGLGPGKEIAFRFLCPRAASKRRRMLLKKAPRLLAKARFFRGICKIHSGSPVLAR